MCGTGYVSVGHVFEQLKDQTQEGCSRHLRRLVEQIYMDLDDGSIRNVDSLFLFDKFFRNVEVSVDSSRAFLSGILKGHDTDELLFQLKVEQAVWKVLGLYPDFHSLYNKYENSDVMEENVCFQLFCLFNRFCEHTRIPMLMHSKAEEFLRSKFGIPHL